MTTATHDDILEVTTTDIDAFDEGSRHGLLKGIIVAAVVAVIAAAIATIFGRRGD